MNFGELEFADQAKLRELYEKIAFPILEEYWRKLKNLRDDERTWSLNSLFLDLIQVGTDPEPNKDGTVNPKLVCVVPPIRAFWDLCMAMFLVYAPQQYRSPAIMAATLLDGLKAMAERGGVSPDMYVNFTSDQLAYLLDLASGKTESLFFKDPIQCMFACKSSFLISARGVPTLDLIEKDDELMKQLELMMEEMEAQEREILGVRKEIPMDELKIV